MLPLFFGLYLASAMMAAGLHQFASIPLLVAGGRCVSIDYWLARRTGLAPSAG